MMQFVLSVGLQEIWNDNAAQEVTGSLRVVHQFVDMPSQQAEYFDPVSRTSRLVSIEIFQIHIVISFTIKRKYEISANIYV
jgi:hypothetical protein